ncbi:hypothetical protein J7K52_03975 [Candidatus Bathyarchaeota archaeon]|nr:hypothetical protein [Candidatus Bathyarchaeota archaeon]PDM26869.1 MAG: hypothetical protein CP083_01670 [Candidatus Bathyarchaeota archaeon B24-2]RLG99718.1 MAG: hypothetical protein DRO28_00955 [Candidatus Bathyarchaeota archaeon]HDM45028.1 hypothetical protein [Candidatus Bathyarchaeota archaeon]
MPSPNIIPKDNSEAVDINFSPEETFNRAFLSLEDSGGLGLRNRIEEEEWEEEEWEEEDWEEEEW